MARSAVILPCQLSPGGRCSASIWLGFGVRIAPETAGERTAHEALPVSFMIRCRNISGHSLLYEGVDW